MRNRLRRVLATTLILLQIMPIYAENIEVGESVTDTIVQETENTEEIQENESTDISENETTENENSQEPSENIEESEDVDNQEPQRGPEPPMTLDDEDYFVVNDEGVLTGVKPGVTLPETIKIPDDVQKIGEGALREQGIKHLFFGKSLQEIGDYAFYGNEIQTINNDVEMYGKKDTVSFLLVTKIGAHAFQFNNLSRIGLAARLEEIEEYAFANNQITELNLMPYKEVMMPWGSEREDHFGSLVKVGAYSFYANKISDLEVGGHSIQEIGDGAFAYNEIKEKPYEGDGFFNKKPVFHTKINSYANIGNKVFAYNGIKNILITENREYPKDTFEDTINQNFFAVDGDSYNYNIANFEQSFYYDNGAKVTVNPVFLKVNYKDTTGKEIQKSNLLDPLIEDVVYESNSENTFLAPAIRGFEPLQNEITFNPNGQKEYEIDIEYKRGLKVPKITAPSKTFTTGEVVTKEKLLQGVTAVDYKGQDIAVNLDVVPETIVTDKKKIEEVYYKVTDAEGNTEIIKVLHTVGESIGQMEFEDGWIYDDFTFDENIVTGLSASGQTKISNNKRLIIPKVNITGEIIKDIGDNAFKNYGITEVVIPDTVEKIGDEAFKDNNITKIDFSVNLLEIGDYAFENNKLEKVVISYPITSVGKGAFKSNNITKIKYYLKNYPDEIFANNKITLVELNNIDSVGDYAFYNNKIDSLKITGSRELVLGKYAFTKNYIGPLNLYSYEADELKISEGTFMEAGINVLSGLERKIKKFPKLSFAKNPKLGYLPSYKTEFELGDEYDSDRDTEIEIENEAFSDCNLPGMNIGYKVVKMGDNIAPNNKVKPLGIELNNIKLDEVDTSLYPTNENQVINPVKIMVKYVDYRDRNIYYYPIEYKLINRDIEVDVSKELDGYELVNPSNSKVKITRKPNDYSPIQQIVLEYKKKNIPLQNVKHTLEYTTEQTGQVISNKNNNITKISITAIENNITNGKIKVQLPLEATADNESVLDNAYIKSKTVKNGSIEIELNPIPKNTKVDLTVNLGLRDRIASHNVPVKVIADLYEGDTKVNSKETEIKGIYNRKLGVSGYDFKTFKPDVKENGKYKQWSKEYVYGDYVFPIKLDLVNFNQPISKFKIKVKFDKLETYNGDMIYPKLINSTNYWREEAPGVFVTEEVRNNSVFYNSNLAQEMKELNEMIINGDIELSCDNLNFTFPGLKYNHKYKYSVELEYTPKDSTENIVVEESDIPFEFVYPFRFTGDKFTTYSYMKTGLTLDGAYASMQKNIEVISEIHRDGVGAENCKNFSFNNVIERIGYSSSFFEYYDAFEYEKITVSDELKNGYINFYDKNKEFIGKLPFVNNEINVPATIAKYAKSYTITKDTVAVDSNKDIKIKTVFKNPMSLMAPKRSQTPDKLNFKTFLTLQDEENVQYSTKYFSIINFNSSSDIYNYFDITLDKNTFSQKGDRIKVTVDLKKYSLSQKKFVEKDIYLGRSRNIIPHYEISVEKGIYIENVEWGNNIQPLPYQSNNNYYKDRKIEVGNQEIKDNNWDKILSFDIVYKHKQYESIDEKFLGYLEFESYVFDNFTDIEDIFVTINSDGTYSPVDKNGNQSWAKYEFKKSVPLYSTNAEELSAIHAGISDESDNYYNPNLNSKYDFLTSYQAATIRKEIGYPRVVLMQVPYIGNKTLLTKKPLDTKVNRELNYALSSDVRPKFYNKEVNIPDGMSINDWYKANKSDFTNVMTKDTKLVIWEQPYMNRDDFYLSLKPVITDENEGKLSEFTAVTFSDSHPNGYESNVVEEYGVTRFISNTSASKETPNSLKAIIKIKQDREGAVFGKFHIVSKASNNTVYTVEDYTQNESKIRLPIGDYSIVDSQTGEEIAKITKEQMRELKNQNKDLVIDEYSKYFLNKGVDIPTKKPFFTILTSDINNHGILGHYKITNKDTGEIKEVRTYHNGILNIDLPYGKYTIEETSVQYPFKVNSEIKEFELKEEMFTDDNLGSIEAFYSDSQFANLPYYQRTNENEKKEYIYKDASVLFKHTEIKPIKIYGVLSSLNEETYKDGNADIGDDDHLRILEKSEKINVKNKLDIHKGSSDGDLIDLEENLENYVSFIPELNTSYYVELKDYDLGEEKDTYNNIKFELENEYTFSPEEKENEQITTHGKYVNNYYIRNLHSKYGSLINKSKELYYPVWKKDYEEYTYTLNKIDGLTNEPLKNAEFDAYAFLFEEDFMPKVVSLFNLNPKPVKKTPKKYKKKFKIGHVITDEYGKGILKYNGVIFDYFEVEGDDPPKELKIDGNAIYFKETKAPEGYYLQSKFIRAPLSPNHKHEGEITVKNYKPQINIEVIETKYSNKSKAEAEFILKQNVGLKKKLNANNLYDIYKPIPESKITASFMPTDRDDIDFFDETVDRDFVTKYFDNATNVFSHEFTTDENGKIHIDLSTLSPLTNKTLYLGVNRFEQTGFASGYYPVDLKPILVEDEYIKYGKTVYIENSTSIKKVQDSIKVAVIDVDTGLRVSGAKISIKNSDEKFDKAVDENGALFTNLTKREYDFTVYSAPPDYYFIKKSIPKKVRLNDMVTLLVKKGEEPQNNKSLKIIKLAEDKQTKLSGVTFKLTKKNDTSFKQQKTTDNNGEILFENLETGIYYLKEIKTKPGHRLINKTFKIEIKDDSPEITVKTIVNYKDNSVLPSTGTTGSIMFILIGFALILISIKRKQRVE